MDVLYYQKAILYDMLGIKELGNAWNQTAHLKTHYQRFFFKNNNHQRLSLPIVLPMNSLLNGDEYRCLNCLQVLIKC